MNLFSFSTFILTSLSCKASANSPDSAQKLGCGELNVVFTGLPPYHPLITSQGVNASAIDAGLRANAAEVLKAGYNLRVVLMGPEQNLSVLKHRLAGIEWHGTGIDYGVGDGASYLQNVTTRFTDIIELYRNEAPSAAIMFNFSFMTVLWAIQSRLPLPSNCTDSPGKDLGFEVFCNMCTG